MRKTRLSIRGRGGRERKRQRMRKGRNVRQESGKEEGEVGEH